VVRLLIKVNTSIQQEYKPIFDVSIRPEKVEMKRYFANWIILAIIEGILLTISFFVLQFWIITRNKSFMYYFLAFFSFLLYFLTNDRVAYAVLGSDFLTRFTSNYFALFSSFFYLNFSRHFLDGEKQFAKWNKVIRSYIYVYFAALVVIILIHTKVIWNVTPYLNFIHVLGFILIIVFSIHALRKGVNQAKYFLVANGIFFIFLTIYIVFLYLKIEYKAPFWVESSLKLGIVAQAFMFAFVIAHRFNVLNREITLQKFNKERLEKEKILEIQKIISSKNNELEGKVMERTAEINHQKEELRTQAEHLEEANSEITKQKKLIERAHTQITDSLFYAAMIQQAMLPKPSLLSLCFRNHFALFRPRDIVSGDFYWAAQIENIKFIAVADCTGHGVPGGFMSMLGISLINEIVKREGITRPDEILNLLRIHLINALQQESMNELMRDGMEISICAIYQTDDDASNNCLTLEYAGAHNPIYVITNPSTLSKQNVSDIEIFEKNESCALYQLRADAMPISMHFKLNPFTLKTIKLFENDMLYLFTDGIIDQIGGNENKKYSSINFRNLLLGIHKNEPQEQMRFIEENINNWMNCVSTENGQVYDQIDDICVLGIRV
jgi:serine phosphatase RsbU (regulator of sigma subunit)